MASLRELQAGFAAAIGGGPAGTEAVAADGAGGDFAAEILAGGFTAHERLQVYRNNSRAMFDGALERTYPVLLQRVGTDFFRQLAHGYRAHHPSRSGDLHWVGRHFPVYLAEHLADSGYEWLAELAALEWACECALVASRAPAAGIEALAPLAAEALASTRLRLQPSLQCVAGTVPVLDVWLANQPGADGQPVDLARGGQCVLVSCGNDGVELRVVEAPTLEFVRQLHGGTPLGEALERADLPLDAVAGVLGLLFAAGLVTGVHPDTTLE
jgi:hypothetical protein